jgi:branched-chain amino acid transport system ATP-binding protein
LDLEFEGVNAWYGQTAVLFDVNGTVHTGEIVALFGHNGAGKSTLLRVIAGIHRRARYSARLGEVPIQNVTAPRLAELGVQLVREGARVFEGLTVQEHLALGARLARAARRVPMPEEDIFRLFPILGDFRARPASQLSGGQRQLLALSTAFTSNPSCMLLDEPSTGLAPQVLVAVAGALRSFAEHGVALLVAEQNPEWLGAIADRAYLLHLGRVVAEGSVESIAAPVSLPGSE